jgi:hypothetical protein
LTFAKASGKAPTSSGHPVSGPSQTKRPVSIPGEFMDESIEIESFAFIIKLLETKDHVTTKELYK